jgi:peptidoglycan/xylan/chitin deacetylase (PgdA/CDA1 family)
LPDPLNPRHTMQRLRAVYKALPGDETEEYLDALGTSLGNRRCPRAHANELWMTWDMLRAMRRGGMTIGAHTVNHPILANLRPERQRQEIAHCRHRLVEELGEPIEAFSYPEGRQTSFDGSTRTALLEHGYRWAFVSDGGYCRPRFQNTYGVHRVPIEIDTEAPLFDATLVLPQLFA